MEESLTDEEIRRFAEACADPDNVDARLAMRAAGANSATGVLAKILAEGEKDSAAAQPAAEPAAIGTGAAPGTKPAFHSFVEQWLHTEDLVASGKLAAHPYNSHGNQTLAYLAALSAVLADAPMFPKSSIGIWKTALISTT